MTYTEPVSAIEGIIESTIVNYFAAFNREQFVETASLFAEAGELLAPFEKPIVGRENIAAYLSEEATGMKVLPKEGILDSESDLNRYKVVGKVKNSLFSVNVAWHFTLDTDGQILAAEIKLLASPQELLGLKSKRDRK